MLPDSIMAVKYRHNPHAHEEEPPTSRENDPLGLLDRLELMNRLSWALLLDEETVFEPDFEDVRRVSGLWSLPCLEKSNNITLLGSRLTSALTQRHISDQSKPGFGPIIIQNSITDEFWGLVEFSYDAFDDEDDDRKPGRKDYVPIYELPENAFIGVSQTELQSFIGALQEPEATPSANQLEALPDDFSALYDAMGAGELPHMDIVIAAWRNFWKERRPDDGKPYPVNAEVADWIKKRMETPSTVLAENMAKIIRPSWAPLGRQSKCNR
ncbi:hypothetical protein DS878_02925 [Marinobacter sp. F3R11]|nr:hypothetical protein DS878_02925 [Marinobacter sp. F3R11]